MSKPKKKSPLERDFQSHLIRDIKKHLPKAIVLKTDPNYIQGLPDLLILHGPRWAALECKRSATARHQSNQDYYVCRMDQMSKAAFIYPENRKEVLDAVYEALES